MAKKVASTAVVPPDGGQPLTELGTSRGRSNRRSHALQILFGDNPLIHRGGPIWDVPSETRSVHYGVNVDRATCECPYWRQTRRLCKHIDAVRIFLGGSRSSRKAKVCVDVVFANPPYNDRLANSGFTILSLLVQSLALSVNEKFSTAEAQGVKGMRKSKAGQPAITWGEILIALAMATYFNRASRKANCWGAETSGLFLRGRPPSPTRLRHAMGDAKLTQVLVYSLGRVSDCLREIETRFAIDSSYYKTPLYELQAQRRGSEQIVVEKIKNAKLHLAVGLRSLTVVAAHVTDGTTSDTSVFMTLWRQFCQRFRVEYVLADAAYDNAAHFEEVASCGGRAYFDQRSNTAGEGFPHHDEMVRLKREDPAGWFAIYNFRSLVECANSIMKRTIKRVIRARRETSRNNELILVCLVYNFLRLAEARIKYRIDIPWATPESIAAIDALRNPA